MAVTVAVHGVGAEGAQGSSTPTDTLFTFSCFSLAQHLKLSLQSHKLGQYGAGTGENQYFSLLWQFYRCHVSQVCLNRFLALCVCNNAWYYTRTETGCYKWEPLHWTSRDGNFHEFKSLRDQCIATEEWECEAGKLYAWSQALSLEDIGPFLSTADTQIFKSYWKTTNPSSHLNAFCLALNEAANLKAGLPTPVCQV